MTRGGNGEFGVDRLVGKEWMVRTDLMMGGWPARWRPLTSWKAMMSKKLGSARHMNGGRMERVCSGRWMEQ